MNQHLSQNPVGSSNRIIALEALRGIASIIVVAHHFLVGFLPGTKYPHAGHGEIYAVGQPFYWLMNGTGAVMFFFVLSGYVLSIGYFQRGNIDSMAVAVVKRFPRLLVPAAASMLMGMVILSAGWDFGREAGLITGSDWLVRFAFAGYPADFQPSASWALWQSVTVFFEGTSYFNTNLWTMPHELAGSFVVFGLAVLISQVMQFKLTGYLIATVLAIVTFRYLYMVPFVIGIYLAALHAHKGLSLPKWFAIGSLILGLMLLCYDEPRGMFSDFKPYVGEILRPGITRVYLLSIGSALVLLAFLSRPTLGKPLSGRFGEILGRMSFPLYLVHTIVICSLSSWVFLRLQEAGVTGGTRWAILFAVTLGASLILSLPLMWLDDWWRPTINRWSKRLLERAFAKP